MDKKNTVLKVVIIIYFLALTMVLPGCGTVIDSSDKLKVVEINHVEEDQRSASSIENYTNRYPQAIQLLEEEKYFAAMVILRNLADYKDGREQYNIALRKQSRISTGDGHVLGLKSDGTLIYTGDKTGMKVLSEMGLGSWDLW